MSEQSAHSPSADAAPAERPPEPARSRLRGLGRYLPAALAALALVLAAAIGLQQRDTRNALSSQDSMLVRELEIARRDLQDLEQQIDALDSALDQRDDAIADLREDASEFPVELRALERRIEELQGGRVDARESWLREQAEYYLVLANTELRLGGRIGNALEALELADSILRTLGDPGLGNVRRAVADELQALRALEPADIEGIVLALGNLGDEAGTLPMRDQAPDNFVGAGDDESGEAGLSRLWSQTRGAVTSIVRVERQDGPVAQLLTEAERRVVRRQFALELQLARVAALEGRGADFRTSLAQADAILERDFHLEAQRVVAARELLARLQRIELEPQLPDISDSLRLLRNASGA